MKANPEAPQDLQLQQECLSKVEYWSDFLCPDMHPWSICELSNYQHGIDHFGTFVDGLQAMKDVKQVACCLFWNKLIVKFLLVIQNDSFAVV